MKIALKRILWSIVTVAILLVAATIVAVANYGYDGPVSDHWDGSRFTSTEPGDHTFADMVKWMWEMENIPWPEWIDDPRQPVPVARVSDDGLRVTYINHATVLIQTDGLNILTDPIWSEHTGPFGRIGPARLRAPGVLINDLPPIDYILISHDHWDHLDMPTLNRIVARDHPTILVGLGVKSLLPDEVAKNAVELDWWQSTSSQVTSTSFTFVPSRHQSGRWPFVQNKTLWGGFVIESATGDQVYFAGDTGHGNFLKQIHERFGQIRLAILPIGNYEKRWMMKSQHMNPDDAVRAHLLLGSGQSMGIHYATFAEHQEQAIDAHEIDLSSALKNYSVPESAFWILKFGEGRDVPPLDVNPITGP